MASATNSLELNLNLKPSYVPKTIANLLKDLSHIHNASEKLAVLGDYINQLEGELNSIGAFKLQLPQCISLIMEALGELKDEFMKIKNGMESSETTGRRRDLADFSATERKQYDEPKTDISASAYAWKGKSTPNSNSCPQLRNYNSTYENKKHKKFLDFIQAQNHHNPISFKETAFSSPSLAEKGYNSRDILNGSYSRFGGSPGTSNVIQSGLNLRADNRTLNYQPRPLTQPIWRNNRRSWSPELHLRFVEALNILGGVEVATPKQIREVMQVEGLTNDQVKSHLQKYRLHCRRVPQKHGDGLLVQDPWRAQIYYGDPNLSPQEDHSDDGNNYNDPQG